MSGGRGPYRYDYPRPTLSVDAAVFSTRDGRPVVLLIQRKHEPFAGRWALPGGFVEEGETLDAAAARELMEETGLCGVPLRQLQTFGDPGRDPRGWSVSVVYVGEADWRAHHVRGADDAAAAAWFSVDALPPLAFDHDKIVQYAVEALGRTQAEKAPTPSGLEDAALPNEGTMLELADTDAIIVVDVQNDFCPGGALPVPEGDRVVRVINRMVNRFDRIVFSRDWHPYDHCSFTDRPAFIDGSWPEHCTQDSPGAEFHGDLIVPSDALIVSKGADPDREAYSAFEGTGLADTLRKWGVTRVFVCGLATDYCVKHTALDARKGGFDVWLLEDACRGVAPETTAAALREMEAAGVVITTTKALE